MFIKNNLSWINIDIACGCLELSRSSYYEWINNEEVRRERLKKKQMRLNLIMAKYELSRKRYGSSKITKSLRKDNLVISKKTVAKIMRENNIRSIVNKKFKATTNSKHDSAVFDNILNRQFVVPKPNYAWVGDITYITTDEGWLYLATMIDLYSNKVVGHAMSDRINKHLVIDALNNALKNRGNPTGVIIHSDRGSQYASNAYKDLLTKQKLIGSMSRKGNCWDNAVAENFFGIIKKEYIYHTKFATRAQGRVGIFDYIEGWYNTQRIHSKLGYLSPDEFENLNAPCIINKNKKIEKNIKMEVKSAQL